MDIEQLEIGQWVRIRNDIPMRTGRITKIDFMGSITAVIIPEKRIRVENIPFSIMLEHVSIPTEEEVALWILTR